MNYKGVIIEESLWNKNVLADVKILKTDVEPVTESHKTPWIKQWTMHTVEIPEDKADYVAHKISEVLDGEHSWYADFKNENVHFVIFRGRVFKINRARKEQYEEAVRYGVSLGIPAYQLDFSPQIREWDSENYNKYEE